MVCGSVLHRPFRFLVGVAVGFCSCPAARRAVGATVVAALAAFGMASSGSCVLRAADLPFGGVCPASELVCPACPPSAPVKCPSGGCASSVRECAPNVVLGRCNATTCEDVHWCHILPIMPYACWEQAPSDHNATLIFSALDVGRCNTCNHLISRYQCASCCGTRGVASWQGSYATTIPNRDEGGVFMQGGRWVCMLRDVAATLSLENEAANLIAPAPPPQPPSPPPPPAESPPPLFNAFTFPMPDEYSLD